MHRSIDQRIVGIQAAAEMAGMDINRLPRLDGDFSMESGAACAAEMLEASPDLTAILCINDRMAMGAIQQARLIGRSVPDDLSVVGYDNIPMASVFAPPLTTIDQLAPDMGQIAAQMLFDILRGERPESIETPTKLIVRQSSALPPT
jgi:DNA-binding LacI/PurR family transcriptional regulator